VVAGGTKALVLHYFKLYSNVIMFWCLLLQAASVLWVPLHCQYCLLTLHLLSGIVSLLHHNQASIMILHVSVRVASHFTFYVLAFYILAFNVLTLYVFVFYVHAFNVFAFYVSFFALLPFSYFALYVFAIYIFVLYIFALLVFRFSSFFILFYSQVDLWILIVGHIQ